MHWGANVRKGLLIFTEQHFHGVFLVIYSCTKLVKILSVLIPFLDHRCNALWNLLLSFACQGLIECIPNIGLMLYWMAHISVRHPLLWGYSPLMQQGKVSLCLVLAHHTAKIVVVLAIQGWEARLN